MRANRTMTEQKNVALVTGCAGFIGSRLTERLVGLGYSVLGVDALRDAYDVSFKRQNLDTLEALPGFRFMQIELESADLPKLLKDVRMVFHLAGQAGVRASWGNHFQVYLRDNVMATQCLLEACVNHPTLERFVFSSSSSVYGNAEQLPVTEDVLPQPVSPYGVTKLGAEHLCTLYQKAYSVPTVSLRYFTVYGPCQRPDMAFHILFKSLLTNTPFVLFGDGEQTRDFTFVSDIVEANILAMQARDTSGVFNIAGGSRVSLNEVIKAVEHISGRKVILDRRDHARGDARHTWADTHKAQKQLGYKPQVALQDGLAMEYEWATRLYGVEKTK